MLIKKTEFLNSSRNISIKSSSNYLKERNFRGKKISRISRFLLKSAKLNSAKIILNTKMAQKIITKWRRYYYKVAHDQSLTPTHFTFRAIKRYFNDFLWLILSIPNTMN